MKCSGHRHIPAQGSSHRHSYSIDAPTSELCGIAGRSYGGWISFPVHSAGQLHIDVIGRLVAGQLPFHQLHFFQRIDRVPDSDRGAVNHPGNVISRVCHIQPSMLVHPALVLGVGSLVQQDSIN